MKLQEKYLVDIIQETRTQWDYIPSFWYLYEMLNIQTIVFYTCLFFFVKLVASYKRCAHLRSKLNIGIISVHLKFHSFFSSFADELYCGKVLV